MDTLNNEAFEILLGMVKYKVCIDHCCQGSQQIDVKLSRNKCGVLCTVMVATGVWTK